MILYYEMIPEENFTDILKNENLELDNKFKMFNFYKQNALLYMNKITVCIENLEAIDDTKILSTILSNLKVFLDKMRGLENLLKDCYKKLDDINFNSENLSIQIEDYNNLSNTLLLSFGEFLVEFEDFTKNILEVIDFQFKNSTSSKKEEVDNNNEELTTTSEPEQIFNDNTKEKDVDVLDSTLTDNNCLTISEKENKVFLPYKIKDLEKILSSSKKHFTINDIINEEYILPLDRFKNPVLSRFRESYRLMKEKEKASFIEAFNLALELSFNSTLNPAVITACKNKDELDIYLDCLEEKELEQFKLFEIKYEINPMK